MLSYLTPIQRITRQGKGRVRITCNLARIWNYCIEFREGEEFEEKLFTGETAKKIIIRDSHNRWIETQLTGKHKGLVYIREVSEDGSLFTVTCHFKGLTAYRYFRRI